MDTILRREKFVPLVQDELSNVELLNKAKEKLGYDPTALAEQKVRNTRWQDAKKVAQALDSLGIEILNKDTVKKYMNEKVKIAQARGSSKAVQYMHSKKGEDVTFPLGFATVVGMIVTLMAALFMSDQKDKHAFHSHVFYGALILFGACGLAWAIATFLRLKPAKIHTADWYSAKIAEYKKPIPDFVLERALQLQEALPLASFAIDYFEERIHRVEVEVTPAVDPFLCFSYGGTKYYLDVWDEPKFEGRRTI